MFLKISQYSIFFLIQFQVWSIFTFGVYFGQDIQVKFVEDFKKWTF